MDDDVYTVYTTYDTAYQYNKFHLFEALSQTQTALWPDLCRMMSIGGDCIMILVMMVLR